MNKAIDDPANGTLEASMMDLLGEVQHEPIPPRLRDLAHRLEEALAAARLRGPQAD